MAHKRCKLDKQDYIHVSACIRPRARVSTCTLARTHRPISNTYCFFTATKIREITSVLRHRHIAPLSALSPNFMFVMVMYIHSNPILFAFISTCHFLREYQLFPNSTWKHGQMSPFVIKMKNNGDQNNSVLFFFG
jgi:hypothetical protein